MNRRIFLLVVLLASAVAAVAQTERRIYTKAEQESSQKRDEEKRIEAIQDSIRAAAAYASLEQLDFVVEANRISFKRGETAYVTSMTNFVSLCDDKAVIQIAPFHSGGPNGVGGITLEGRAYNIKLSTDKKGNVTLSMSVSGTGLSATVNVFLPQNGYMATVTVNPNFSSNRVTLYGVLVPSARSSVYKGSSL
ncbi:MAG: DUF4251 domain-containing protein [Muribaculaceae bacterium]